MSESTQNLNGCLIYDDMKQRKTENIHIFSSFQQQIYGLLLKLIVKKKKNL